MNNFNIQMVLLCLALSCKFLSQPVWWHMVWRVRAQVLRIRVYQLSNVIDHCHVEQPKFIHIDGLVHLYYNLSGYLSPPTRVPLITGWQYLLEYHTIVLFAKTQFSIRIETVNQLGFEPGFPGPKVATLTIELHFIDFGYLLSKYENSIIYHPCFVDEMLALNTIHSWV